MNIGKSLIAAAVSGIFALSAAELKIDGNFQSLGKDNLPANWLQHKNWAGFKPFASFELAKGIQPGENAVHIFNTQSKNGVSVRTARRIPGVAGDTVKVVFKARGKGTAYAQLYYYTREGKWNQTSAQQFVKLTDQWTEYPFQFVISDSTNGKTGTFDVVFGGKQGLDAEFTSIRAYQNEPVPQTTPR